MAKKYIVELTADEREHLKDFVRRGKQSARRLTRARILLLSDETWTDAQIWTALQIGKCTVERTRQRFVEEGLEAALSERPRPGQPRKLKGKQEALLVALACSDPPKGHQKWTMQLLADRLVELKVVDSIADETVRRVLKKTTSNPGRRSSGASRR
jgi:transposase